MKARRCVALLVAALAAVGFVLPAVRAFGASNGQTSFAPTSTGPTPRDFFQYTLAAGSTIVDTAVLTNLTSQRQAYSLYAADAGDVDGSFAIARQEARPISVGSWVTLPVHSIVLGPHQKQTIRVTLAVPANATPGDHAGGVVALANGATAASPGSNVQLRARYGVGIRIYLRVAGPVSPHMALTHLSLKASGGLLGGLVGRDRGTVSYTVANTGNLRLAPSGKVVVSTFGKSVRSMQTLNELLPGSSISRVVAAKGLRWTSLLGVMRARVTVTAGPGVPPITAEVTRMTVPWLLILVIVAAIVAAVVWRRRRYRGRRRMQSDGPAAPSGNNNVQLVV